MRIFDTGTTLAEIRRKVGTKEPITLGGASITSIILAVDMLYDVTHCSLPVTFPRGWHTETGEKVWLIAGDTVPAEPGDEEAYMALVHTSKAGKLIQAFLVTEPDPSRAILFPCGPLFVAFSKAAAADFTSTARSY